MSKKMMLNDVVQDIKDLSVSSKENFDLVPVMIKLSADTIKKAQEIYKEKIHEKIDNLIYDTVSNTTNEPGEIIFNGKTQKIKADVIRNLKAVGDYFMIQSSYPFFKLSKVNLVIKEIMGPKDPRTYDKYLECIKHAVKTGSNNELNHYQEGDISCFVKGVKLYLSKQHRSASSFMEK